MQFSMNEWIKSGRSPGPLGPVTSYTRPRHASLPFSRRYRW